MDFLNAKYEEKPELFEWSERKLLGADIYAELSSVPHNSRLTCLRAAYDYENCSGCFFIFVIS